MRRDAGGLSYRATAETGGRMQAAFAAAGLGRGLRVAVLAANRAEAFWAGQARQVALTPWGNHRSATQAGLSSIKPAAPAGARVPQGFGLT